MPPLQLGRLALGVATAVVLTGCSTAADECAAAAAHAQECFGGEPGPQQQCDPDVAREVLSRSCEELRAGKGDAWWEGPACAVGIYCPYVVKGTVVASGFDADDTLVFKLYDVPRSTSSRISDHDPYASARLPSTGGAFSLRTLGGPYEFDIDGGSGWSILTCGAVTPSASASQGVLDLGKIEIEYQLLDEYTSYLTQCYKIRTTRPGCSVAYPICGGR